ncbi:MAG: hypothetical protein K2N79_04155 [Muribaculaceae bacterium]|nr:hypothetical protein [Muribaculaceae bacterium]MDE7368345.1 hypothetical protein [Muribaculaceae bacterium]
MTNSFFVLGGDGESQNKCDELQKKLNEYEATGDESTDYDYYDKWADAFEECANGNG